MKVVRYNRKSDDGKNYLLIANSWWKARGGNDFPAAFVSDYGFMVFDENDMAQLSVFFYPTIGLDSCMWGLHVANPSSTKEIRKEAMKFLTEAVSSLAKDMGYKILIGYPGKESFKDRLVENGFHVLESNSYQCAKVL